MFRLILALALVFSASASQSSIPQQDIDNAMARAEALYFEARFKESIEVILPLDAALRQEPDRVKDRIRVKLQIALGHVGLNETTEAKARFIEVCALDSAFALAPDQFASKVITLFDDAKTQYTESRCATVCQEVDKLLDLADVEALLSLMESQEAGCPCVQAAAFDAAELSFQKGVEAYKENNFAAALNSLRMALKLRPMHELAAQYVELTQNQMRLAADRLFLEWRQRFDSRDFPQAALKYRDLASSNVEGVAATALDQIRSEYRKMLTSMAESWTRACTISDVLAAETRRQATAMVPEPSVGEDILAKMTTCPAKMCLAVTSQLAMVRLKTRVGPELSRNQLPTRSTTIRVKVRIDEKGDVEVQTVQGGNTVINSAVRAAVAQWKFTPAMLADQPRCVETELPIVVNPAR